MTHSRSWLVGLVLISLSITGLRIFYASNLGLAPDEAYYWQWSNNLALSYADHPPLIAWLIRASTLMVGESSLGVRLPCIMISLIAIFVAYKLSRAIGFEQKPASLFAMITTLLPAPAVGSIIATPDTPLGLAWLLALLALARLAIAHSTASWYLLGASLGVGLLAKLSALLILPTTLIAMIALPRIRQDLRSAHPWLATALALVIALPYLVAEIRAGYPSIAFQLAHLSGGLEESSAGALNVITRLAELLGGQMALLTPLVGGWALISYFKNASNKAMTVLALGFLVPFGATCMSALFTHPEQNWASLGHPAAFLSAMGAISVWYPKNSPDAKHPRQIWNAAIVATVCLTTGIIHLHAAHPFLPLSPDRDPVSRLYGWEQLVALESNAKKVDAIVADNYGLAAEVAWHLRHLQKPVPTASTNRPPPPASGRWLLLEEHKDWGNAKLNVICRQIGKGASTTLTRADNKPLRTITIFQGEECHQ